MAYKRGHVKRTPKTSWKAQDWYGPIAEFWAQQAEAAQAAKQAQAGSTSERRHNDDRDQ